MQQDLSSSVIGSMICNWQPDQFGRVEHLDALYALKYRSCSMVIWHDYARCIYLGIMALILIDTKQHMLHDACLKSVIKVHSQLSAADYAGLTAAWHCPTSEAACLWEGLSFRRVQNYPWQSCGTDAAGTGQRE